MTAVHPQLRSWLDQLNRMIAEQRALGIEGTPQLARDTLAGLTATFVTEAPEIALVRDVTIDTGEQGVDVRIYDPAPDQDKPVCVFIHGGGHMSGSVAVYDPIARKLAHHSQHLVVSVDYRLAPETPYPGGLNDCFAVVRQLWDTLAGQGLRFRRQLALAGDSGGGTFAATLGARLAGDPDITLTRQVLIYPSVDYTMGFASMDTNGEGYLLEKSRIQWYFDHYFQHGEDRRAASPLNMPVPADMPATLVIAAGFCPLRDEGVAYADRLRAAGITCELEEFGDMIHAYLNLENLVPEACRETYRRIGEFLNN